MYQGEKPLGLFSTDEVDCCVLSDAPGLSVLTNQEKKTIEEQIGRQYLRCWQEEGSQLQAMVVEQEWFGFDLDGIWHEFRRASSTAMDKVFEEIA